MKFETQRAKDVYVELMDMVVAQGASALVTPDTAGPTSAEFTRAKIQAADVALKLDVALMAAELTGRMAAMAEATAAALKELDDAE